MQTFQIKNWLFTRQDNGNSWQRDFDDHLWSSVSVPHDWAVAEPFSTENSSGTGYLAGGIGWYRAHVSTKELNFSLKNTITYLHFTGAYKNAEVWVNGYHLGNRPSGYSEFEFDLTELLSYSTNDEIVIAVRLEHSDLADSRWYTGSGINRPVFLECHQPVLIANNDTVFTASNISPDSAKIQITHTIRNTTGISQHITIKDNLHNPDSHLDAGAFNLQAEIDLPANDKQTITLTGIFNNPQLWSLDTPNLYELTTSLTSKTKISSEYQTIVGIRSIRFDADHGFFLNDQGIKIKGVCLHEDAGCLGSAVPIQVWLRRLLKLKKMGVNAIRMSHNPHTPALYSLCDLLGFLVFDEAFDEWENPKNKWWQGHNVYPPKFEGYAHQFTEWFEKDLSNLIRRNRNHPAIIAWSIGNEIDYPNDPYANKLFTEMTGNNDNNKPEAERVYNQMRPDTRRLTTIAKRLIKIVKTNDTSRPVTLAAAFPELSAKTGLIDDLDVVGYNYKEFLYQQDHLKFPTKPFIGSENSHSFEAWSAVTDNDFISGQFLWTGIDYLGEAAGWPIHGSGAGLLTLAGFEKSNYFLRKSWWNDNLATLAIFTAPATNDLQHDNDEWLPVTEKWDYPEGTPVIVRIYTNCTNLELKLGQNGISQSVVTSNGYQQLIIPYQHKPLTVIGQYKGQPVSKELRPLGTPVAITSAIWTAPKEITKKLNQLSSFSERNNVVQIEIGLEDYQHRACSTDLLIHVTVKDGKLLGLENGDLADNTSYAANYRRTYQGRMIAYIRTTTGKKAQVTLSANGYADNIIYTE